MPSNRTVKPAYDPYLSKEQLEETLSRLNQGKEIILDADSAHHINKLSLEYGFGINTAYKVVTSKNFKTIIFPYKLIQDFINLDIAAIHIADSFIHAEPEALAPNPSDRELTEADKMTTWLDLPIICPPRLTPKELEQYTGSDHLKSDLEKYRKRIEEVRGTKSQTIKSGSPRTSIIQLAMQQGIVPFLDVVKLSQNKQRIIVLSQHHLKIEDVMAEEFTEEHAQKWLELYDRYKQDMHPEELFALSQSPLCGVFEEMKAYFNKTAPHIIYDDLIEMERKFPSFSETMQMEWNAYKAGIELQDASNNYSSFIAKVLSAHQEIHAVDRHAERSSTARHKTTQSWEATTLPPHLKHLEDPSLYPYRRVSLV